MYTRSSQIRKFMGLFGRKKKKKTLSICMRIVRLIFKDISLLADLTLTL